MDKLDQDWVKLIFEAKDLGLSIQDLREYFLNQPKLTAKEIPLR